MVPVGFAETFNE